MRSLQEIFGPVLVKDRVLPRCFQGVRFVFACDKSLGLSFVNTMSKATRVAGQVAFSSKAGEN